MRQLHFVGFTSDNDGLILAARRGAKTGTFVVQMDDELLDQIERARLENEAKATPAAPPAIRKNRVESNLSPREMQTRLRGGRTVAQVAAEAGVDIEWVERFAAPILAEQAAAVTRAFELVVRTPRRGSSDRPLAPSVVRNLADRGIRLAEDEFESAWSAFQLADNEWVIRFLYRSRGRDQHAEWLLDTAAGSLVPHNRLGTEMGYVDPGRHAPPVRDLPPVRVRGSVRRRRRVRKARAAKQTGPPRTVAPSKKVSAAARTARPRKPAVKKVVRAKKVANKKVTARRAVSSSAGTKWAVTKRAVTKRAVTKRAVTKRAVTNRAGTKRAGSKRASTAKAATKRASARKAPAKKRTPAKRVPARKTTASRSSGAAKRTVVKKSAAKKSAARSTARKNTPAKKAGVKKAGVKKAGATKATSARKSAGAKRAPTAKKAPAGNRAVAASVVMPTAAPRLNRPLRADRIASDGAAPRPLQTIRMTATGPALRPLRARRVETSDAPIGAGQFPRPRTNTIGGPALQFRSGGPGEQEIPGLGV